MMYCTTPRPTLSSLSDIPFPSCHALSTPKQSFKYTLLILNILNLTFFLFVLRSRPNPTLLSVMNAKPSLDFGRGDLYDPPPVGLVVPYGLYSHPFSIDQAEEIDFHLCPDLAI